MGNNKRRLAQLLKRPETIGYNEAVGGLGTPSKMPGYAYGLSPERCRTGSKLRKVPGSVCASCYACKGNYRFSVVIRSHKKRWEAMQDIVTWEESMTALLQVLGTMLPHEERYFRFHDSGDLQGIRHLLAISWVASRNPSWRFWLPTKEYDIVRKFTKQYAIPRNLVIRLSAMRLDEKASGTMGLPTSSVGYNKGFQCPARNQGNECGACRECWKRRYRNVNYAKH